MTRTRRNFTPEERLSILQEGEREGHSITLRKYQIAPSLYARWKHKYLQEGIYGLKDKHKKVDPALRELELENERLKRISEKDGQEYYIPLLYFSEPQGIENYYLIQLNEEIWSRRYAEDFNWEFSILSDEFLQPYVNGLNVNLGANPRGFEYPLYQEGNDIYIALSSLTKNAYKFYKAILQQFNSDGGAYQLSPASPPSNISNGGLGYFRASSISESRVKILKSK